MAFYTYMIECVDDSIYTGHTDDLEPRVQAHFAETYPCYTVKHPPRRLIWHEAFPTRHDAIAAERQIKGWTRKKKWAFARGDWGELVTLSRE